MNDADRHLLTLFSAALERETDEARAAFLDSACGGDAGLRERIEALLRAHDRPGRFLAADESPTASRPGTPEGPADGSTASFDLPTEGLGTSIGPYRLLQVIGEGGMGTVYLAEQTEPVRRRVALKVVTPGMDSRQVLARFEAERQALALMEHPNIARVLDAGATPNGRPYFVMELVKGVPITRFCDERRLTPRQRLELMVPVCQAVQHAHQKGVIHRDLKPSNVLVALYDDKPVPKVIDFGIAKAAGTTLSGATVFTEFGAIIGTLEYMSPEQAQLNQLDVDTRSDVYSLGVLLYELLTGTTPMDRAAIGQAALLDVLKLIREAETPRPSLRLSTSAGRPSIAANRGLEPRTLSGLVRGDLDWIVMKALEKDRSRRYETANALARDIQRHLNDEDVEACPPSAAYRLRKFARRHRAGLTVGAAIAASLVAATSVSTWQAVRATKAERAAVVAAEVQRRTNEFFIDDLLGKASLGSQVVAGIAPDPDLKVRTLIDRAAARLDGRFAGQPLVEAAVRRTIGRAYSSLGRFELGRPHVERAHQIERELLGEDHPSTLGTAAELGQIETDLGQYAEAERRLRDTLDRATRAHGASSTQVVTILGALARCLEAMGRPDESAATIRRAMEIARSDPSVPRSHLLTLRNNLALTLTTRGDEAGAEAVLEEALREGLADVGEDHPIVPLLRINASLIQRLRGQNARAEDTARKALDGCRKLYGDSHPATLSAMRNLGLAQMGRDRLDEAEQTLRTALQLAAGAYGAESVTAIHSAVALADVLRTRGDLREADRLLVANLEPARRVGPRVAMTVEAMLGVVRQAEGQFPESELLLRKVEAYHRASPAPEFRHLLSTQRALAQVIAAQGRHREAADRLRDALTRAEAAFGKDDAHSFQILSDLVLEWRVLGQNEEAEATYPRLIKLGEALYGPDARDVQAVRQNYAALLHVRGNFEAAEAAYRDGLDILTRLIGPEDMATVQIMCNLGELYRDWGQADRAVPLITRSMEIAERRWGPENPHVLWALWKLAELERDRGRPEIAEPMFRRCVDGYARAQGNDGLELATLRADLAMNHLKKNEPALAEPLLRLALKGYDRHLPDDWRRFEILGQLGETLALLGRHEEAEPLVLGGYEGLEQRKGRVTVDARSRRPEAGLRVVRLYESWGKAQEVARWKERLGAAPAPPTESATKPPAGSSDGSRQVPGAR